ncbi:hydrolase 1, exosortase A system-associated [Sedimenticola selenatireducens]|uniref:Hydrolase 1, exosortase A system-associated n=1 Tax=Sedimenticola selenatireducens TaxID=191960 RepID=A0A557S834_9GAMM|nr:hydrolase 1, exosortase A system-associated [Sedimenticola selenatireducens]TVO73588.1 hydrolase 1, exosortase A system-associated [Sedimenticola selenatireducens]TVT63528.1 MAG: hydrolase 1, exosortase A system-associated [Sedimenticola selenatireducens]
MQSRFIQGKAGAIHLSLFHPKNTTDSWVICFPPFAEEMNKSRKMMSAQARSWSSTGIAVVIPDLYGTGDSGGDFSDADWDTWCTDMLGLVAWIRGQGGKKIYFWGIRLGSLLALEVSKQLAGVVSGLLFWQPVINGQQSMTQFLRLRMAASMMDGTQEKVSDLRSRLEIEGALEVAGYELSSKLVSRIDELSMQNITPNAGLPVFWFEISSNTEKPLSIASKKIVDQWRQEGIDIDAELVAGDPFWTTQEITMAPSLIKRTTDALIANKSISEGESVFLLTDPEPQDFISEHTASFTCNNELLPAIVHPGKRAAKRGVLIVVGGPQYRVGSHRQFVLLARDLAEKGVPAFRFDYRGIGDGTGLLTGFDNISDDICSAIDCFQMECPSVTEVVIWGLCDAATAAAFYAPLDNRISGLVLLNPWVRSEVGEAKAYIKHYYVKRLLSKGFWKKIISGRFNLLQSLHSLRQMIRKASGRTDSPSNTSTKDIDMIINTPGLSLGHKMEDALGQFKGKLLFVLSGNDLTAAEFQQTVDASPRFQTILDQGNSRTIKMGDADHTFSRRVWRNSVATETVNWLKSW